MAAAGEVRTPGVQPFTVSVGEVIAAAFELRRLEDIMRIACNVPASPCRCSLCARGASPYPWRTTVYNQPR